MNKHIRLTAVLLMISACVFAQTTTGGKVIDAATNLAIQGATISDLQNKNKTITDKDGNFYLSKSTGSIEMMKS